MKTGITIITKDRQDIVDVAICQHFKYSTFDRLVIVDDHSTQPVTNPLPASLSRNIQVVRPPVWSGVAGARNYGLSMIDDCDIMFVMDDDVFPKAAGGIDAYVLAFRMFPSLHMMGGMPNAWAGVVGHWGNFVATQGTTGVLFAITQTGLKTIGGFDGFGAKYGYDDADYYHRAHLAGLTPFGAHCTITDFEKYFHVCDLYGDFEGLRWAGASTLGDKKLSEMDKSGPAFSARDTGILYKPYK